MPVTLLEEDAPAIYSAFNAIFTELDNNLQDVLGGQNGFLQLAIGRSSGVAISAGEITVIRSVMAIDTEGGAPTDDLHTINRTTGVNILFLQCANAAHVVTVKHNVGNIYLWGQADIVLNNQRTVLPLVHDGSKWTEFGSGQWSNMLNIGVDTTLTIAGGAITVTKTRHGLATQGGLPTDNLDLIEGGFEGAVVFLNVPSTEQVVTIRHLWGNIRTLSGNNLVLDSLQHTAVFVFDGDYWNEINGQESLQVKDVLDDTYLPVRKLQLPKSTFRALGDEEGVYEALVTPSPEVRNIIRIRGDGLDFYSGDSSLANSFNSISPANIAAGYFMQINTSAVNNNVAYVGTADLNVARVQWDPVFVATVKLDGATSNRRIWVGLFSDYPGADDPSSALSGLGFRYSTTAGDTTWKAVASDGGGTLTVEDTLVAVAGATKYTLKLWVNSDTGSAYFTVNNSEPVIISADLPSASDNLGIIASIQTLTAAARGLGISSIYLEHD